MIAPARVPQPLPVDDVRRSEAALALVRALREAMTADLMSPPVRDLAEQLHDRAVRALLLTSRTPPPEASCGHESGCQ